MQEVSDRAMLPHGVFSPSDLHQGAECSSVLSWCPETPAAHPSPTWRKLGHKRHLGASAISQIVYPALQSKGVVSCALFSVPKNGSQFSLSILFFQIKKKKKVKCTLRENERYTVANSLTVKSWALSLCLTQKQPGNQMPRLSATLATWDRAGPSGRHAGPKELWGTTFNEI